MEVVIPLTHLLRELNQAAHLAHLPEVAATLADVGLGFDRRPAWGFAPVTADRQFYEPDIEGKMAGIVGAYEDGVLVDLVATSLETRAMRTRLGIARLLGEETIERARRLDRPVLIFNDPLSWLCSRCCGVVIVDWRCAPFRLADVPGLVCQNEMLAHRLKRAFDNPQPLPPVFVPQPQSQSPSPSEEIQHAA